MPQTNQGPERGPTATPRWVKVFGITLIALVFLTVVMLLFGGGNHGPRRHLPARENGSQRP